MKQRLFMITLLTASLHTFAQRATKKVEQSITQLHQAVFLDKNPEALRPLLSSELIYVHTDGRFETRDSLLQRIHPDKGATYSNFNASTISLRFPNKQTALVKQLVTADVLNNGQTTRLNIYLLMVWVKAGGGWVLEMRQAVKA